MAGLLVVILIVQHLVEEKISHNDLDTFQSSSPASTQIIFASSLANSERSVYNRKCIPTHLASYPTLNWRYNLHDAGCTGQSRRELNFAAKNEPTCSAEYYPVSIFLPFRWLLPPPTPWRGARVCTMHACRHSRTLASSSSRSRSSLAAIA